jgi:hypothetical protein
VWPCRIRLGATTQKLLLPLPSMLLHIMLLLQWGLKETKKVLGKQWPLVLNLGTQQ